MSYSIKDFRADDAAAIIELRLLAIQVVGTAAYSARQIDAWTARIGTASDLLGRVANGDLIYVAVDDRGRVAAYALLQTDGHLDHLYGHPDHTRQGLADKLLEHCEEIARAAGIPRLYTEASELARPAFLRAGYEVTHRRDFEIDHDGQSVPIHNYAMEKALS